MATLDVRFIGSMDKDASLLFNKISTTKREGFNQIVAQISEKNINNVDWWSEGPASRNTYSSPFFHRYCSFFLIKNMIDRQEFLYEEILVDSEAFKVLIQKLLSDKGIKKLLIRVVHSDGFIRRLILKRYLILPILFFKIIVRFLAAKYTKQSSALKLPEKPLVLVDTFMLPEYTNKDRWYGVFWNNLLPEQKKNIYFVPTIVMTPILALVSIFKQLRHNERNFLIKEDYLTFKDIVWSFGYRKRLKKIHIPSMSVLGCDFTSLVKDELYNNRDILTVIESLLIYRFIKRLNEHKINVRLCIDWFEGQAVDKIWNYGFKKYFPSVKRLGLRGGGDFPFYLSTFPIPVERSAGVIPDVFAVQGNGAIASVREFMPDAEVIIIPSFRTLHVWDETLLINGNSETFTILVPLPISVKVTNRIIRLLLEVYSEIITGNRRIKFILKVHPACRIDKEYQQLIANLPSVFLLTKEKSFPILVRKSNLLVSEASSTCLEALALGVPVIVIHNENGLTYDPIPKAIPKNLYKNILTSAELISALNFYIANEASGKSEQLLQGNLIKRSYFEPMSMRGMDKFLDLKIV